MADIPAYQLIYLSNLDSYEYIEIKKLHRSGAFNLNP